MNMIALPVSQHASRFGGERSLENAEKNMAALIRDAGLESAGVTSRFKEYSEGYYHYTLYRWLRTCDVSMPGLPLGRVRFMSLDGQDVFDFPRLYVEGCSWTWRFAVDIVRSFLTGEG